MPSYIKTYTTFGQRAPITGALADGCWPIMVGDRVVIPAGTLCSRDKEAPYVTTQTTQVTVSRRQNGYNGDADGSNKTNPRVFWKNASTEINNVALPSDFVYSRSDGKGNLTGGVRGDGRGRPKGKKSRRKSVVIAPNERDKKQPDVETPETDFGYAPVNQSLFRDLPIGCHFILLGDPFHYLMLRRSDANVAERCADGVLLRISAMSSAIPVLVGARRRRMKRKHGNCSISTVSK